MNQSWYLIPTVMSYIADRLYPNHSICIMKDAAVFGENLRGNPDGSILRLREKQNNL